jgi:protein TonB
MHLGEIFKKDHSEACELKDAACGNNGNTRKDLLFAMSASLAMHIGIVIILTTATAMSTGLKIWEDPVLHVSLVSSTAGREADIKDLSEITLPMKEPASDRANTIEPQVVVKPIEKKARDKISVEPVTSRVVEMQSIKPMVASISRPTNLRTNDESTTLQGNEGYGESVAGPSPATGISLAVPRYRENVHPAYPLIARIRGYEGVVLLSVEISADGGVGGLRIKRSSGYAMLDRSALEAVKTWKFEPGRKMGKPANMWVEVPVKFILRDNEQM